jgi:hypothetical protein
MGKAKDKEDEIDFKGCYGERVLPSQLLSFLDDVFDINTSVEKTTAGERFATCIWGHAGCVLADTVVEVRKVGNKGIHKLNVVNPVPE